MQRAIMIAGSNSVTVLDVAKALRAAGMRVIVDDRILIVHRPHDLPALPLVAFDLDEEPALLRRQAD